MMKQQAPLLLLLLCCYLPFLITKSHAFSGDNVQRYQKQKQRTVVTFLDTRQPFVLWASKKDTTKGVYVRPSAAIERGSGFFIPGLEGPKVRLVFGVVVLLLTTVNRALTHSAEGTTITVTETLAIVYAMLLLLQAAIEFGKEERGFVVSLLDPAENNMDRAEVWTQRWQQTIQQTRMDQIQWSAASYLALTPATNIMLIQNNTVLYRLGTLTNNDSGNEADACLAALQTLGKAKSGRISIPSTHPAAMALVNEADRRCVVLQTINDTECWMMTSNQLLAAFTQQDLKWLGQLAKYVALI